MAIYFEGASLFGCRGESRRSEQDLQSLRDSQRRVIDSVAQFLRCGVDFDSGVVEWEESDDSIGSGVGWVGFVL